MIRIAAILLCLLPGCRPAKADTVAVAVAANFRSTLTALQPLFTARTGHHLRLSSGSTGKLYAQITRGAPWQVFLAADRQTAERLVREERGTHLRIYARGRLVLWNKNAGKDLRRLVRGDSHRIALASPTAAPYGRAARTWLENQQIPGIAARSGRLLYGENVGQVMQFAMVDDRVIALVAHAQVLSLPRGKQGSVHIPAASASPGIDQAAVLLPRGRGQKAAAAFLAFLLSPGAQDLIAEKGYGRGDPPPAAKGD